VLEPKDVSEHATAPQAENVVEHTPAVSKSGGDPEIGLNTSKIADQVPLPKGELTVGGLDPSTDDELLGRAIGMIRCALQKGSA
jgi:hypothetical protein